MAEEPDRASWASLGLKLGLTILLYHGLLLPAYYLWLHPLARFPGPKSWAISQLPWTWMFCSGQSHRRLLQLHERYGVIVRIGPNELSYTVPEAWDAIMGRRKGGAENPKAPWYCSPANHDIVGAAASDHARMRRLLSHAFSAGAIVQQQSLIKSHIDLLIRRLHDMADEGRAAVDIGSWYNYCSFDIIGHLSFGEPFGCLQEAAMHPWMKMIFANIRTSAIGLALLRFPLLRVVLPWLVPPHLRRLADDLRRVFRDKVAKRLKAGSSNADFIGAMLSGYGGLAVTREELDNNAMVLTIAGSETTATALTGATYLTAQHPSVMAKLVDEVRGSFADQDAIDLVSAAKLPYLRAVIHESLRIFPPGPNAQPRVTPAGGAVILGQRLPGHTVLGIPQRAMFLSEANFHRAREFIPERWLGDGQGEFSRDRRDCLNPFSVGPRSCIGVNLAYAELGTILARMVWNFDLRIAETSRNWMDEQDSYLLWDKTTALVVHISPAAAVQQSSCR